MRSKYLYAGIFCVTLLAYYPALHGGMLWDDDHHVTASDLQPLDGLRRIWFEPGATQQYYPLLHTAFWAEHRLWGDRVLGYHLLSVLLHAAAACLLAAIVRSLGLPGAWLAGFIFALHPVCVEAVAWISEQKTTLSAVFALSAVLFYLSFDRTRRRTPYFLATLMFLLALLTKTVTATVPAALLVLLWWRRGSLAWRRDVLPLVPWFLIGVPAGLATAWIERTSIGAQGPEFALTAAQRFLIAGRALCFYLWKIVAPVNLMFTYPRWTPDPHAARQYLYPAAIVLLFVVLAVAARRGHRGPLAGFLIFSGTLFPVLGFLNVYPFRFSFVADHFQYLACTGIIVPIAAAWPGRRVAAVALVAALGFLTWRQTAMYRDAETLYRATLASNPGSWMAHTNLCALLLNSQQGTSEAIAHCQAALRLKPGYAEAHNDLGTAFTHTPARWNDAIAEFHAAIRAKPNFAEAHFNLANVMALTPGRADDAIAEYRAALRIRPDYVEAHMNLASVLARSPAHLGDAIAEYREALRINPNLAEAYNNLGSALAQIPGRESDAILEFENALRVKPDYAKAHNNLGSVLARIPGRLPEAIVEYQAAVDSNPNYADAHYNLGVELAKAARTDEAIAQFETVLRLEPDSVKAHYNLGVLLARIEGREQEALSQFQAVLRLNPDPGLQRMVDRLQMKQRANGTNGHVER